MLPERLSKQADVVRFWPLDKDFDLVKRGVSLMGASAWRSSAPGPWQLGGALAKSMRAPKVDVNFRVFQKSPQI